MHPDEWTEVRNEHGACLILDTCIDPPSSEWVCPNGSVEGNLKLVCGIGPVTEQRLKHKGLETIYRLLNHERWGRRAKTVVDAIGLRDARALSRSGATDREILGLHSLESLAFLDIETTGLYSLSSLFLIGLALPSSRGWRLIQILARNLDEEHAVIDAALAVLRGRPVLVTYNGKTFDIPFIRSRLAYYGREDTVCSAVIDLLCHARRRYRGDLPDCRLTTVEQAALGLHRQDDIPGSMVPEVYYEYARSGDHRIIQPVLTHNAQDLISLTRLLPILV